jgi:hypothetical protein
MRDRLIPIAREFHRQPAAVRRRERRPHPRAHLPHDAAAQRMPLIL